MNIYSLLSSLHWCLKYQKKILPPNEIQNTGWKSENYCVYKCSGGEEWRWWWFKYTFFSKFQCLTIKKFFDWLISEYIFFHFFFSQINIWFHCPWKSSTNINKLNIFSLHQPLGWFSHRVAVSVCLFVCMYCCETPTSGGRGDLWLKNVFLLLTCDVTK